MSPQWPTKMRALPYPAGLRRGRLPRRLAYSLLGEHALRIAIGAVDGKRHSQTFSPAFVSESGGVV